VSALCRPMSGRLPTYRVVIADKVTLGFISLDVSAQQWIARTAGSDKTAACPRNFSEKDDAVQWLQEREQARVEVTPPRSARVGGANSASPEAS
jgi:hypothetical protein